MTGSVFRGVVMTASATKADRALRRLASAIGHRTTLESPPTKSPWGLQVVEGTARCGPGVTPSYPDQIMYWLSLNLSAGTILPAPTQRVGPFFLAAQQFCTLLAHCGGD